MQPQRVANGRPRTSTFEKPGSVQVRSILYAGMRGPKAKANYFF